MAPETSRLRATSRLLTVLSTRVQGPCSVPAGSGLRSPRPLATSDHPLGTDSGPDRRAMRTGTARGGHKALSLSAGAHACRPRSQHGQGREAASRERRPRPTEKVLPPAGGAGHGVRTSTRTGQPRVPPSSPATPRLAAAGPRRARLPAPSSPPACGADRREPRENHATQQTLSEWAASAGRVALTSVCPQTPSLS